MKKGTSDEELLIQDSERMNRALALSIVHKIRDFVAYSCKDRVCSRPDDTHSQMEQEAEVEAGLAAAEARPSGAEVEPVASPSGLRQAHQRRGSKEGKELL